MGFNQREWALNWLKGSIVSYMRGRISLVMLLGRVRRCIESYGITPSDIEVLIEVIVRDPALNLGSSDERVKRLEPLMEFLSKVKG
ncbi:MAG: hypothetical protein QXV81_06750 [Ignisphaera sp.]|uniref:Uncharacterized protein n=1 Tax=Ignisphaera aggregans TaxID=334771 RepID=A0A7J3JQL1_9CREN